MRSRFTDGFYIVKLIQMDALSYKTQFPKAHENEEWFVVDAKDKVLGRLCSEIARVLRGKHKPSFSPFVMCGDKVIVLNADKIVMTGKKWTDREVARYSGYPGGLKVATPREVLHKHPERLIELAVKGMLPKNKLGRRMMRNLFVYTTDTHPHSAQQPKELNI